jgi:hypothetical protein
VWAGSAAVTAIARTIDPFKEYAELKLLCRCTTEEIGPVEQFCAPQPQAGERIAIIGHLRGRNRGDPKAAYAMRHLDLAD